MGKFLKIVAAVAILVTVPKVVQKAMGMDEKSQLDKHMSSFVGELKAKLPNQVGPGISLTDSAYEKATQTLRNTYTIDRSADFDPARRSQYEKIALQQVCQGPYKELSKRGVTVEFRYKYIELGLDNTLDIVLPPGKCR